MMQKIEKMLEAVTEAAVEIGLHYAHRNRTGLPFGGVGAAGGPVVVPAAGPPEPPKKERKPRTPKAVPLPETPEGPVGKTHSENAQGGLSFVRPAEEKGEKKDETPSPSYYDNMTPDQSAVAIADRAVAFIKRHADANPSGRVHALNLFSEFKDEAGKPLESLKQFVKHEDRLRYMWRLDEIEAGLLSAPLAGAK